MTDIVEGDVWVDNRRHAVIIVRLTPNTVHYKYVKNGMLFHRSIDNFKSRFQPER